VHFESVREEYEIHCTIKEKWFGIVQGLYLDAKRDEERIWERKIPTM
jgi:hypothetical protein